MHKRTIAFLLMLLAACQAVVSTPPQPTAPADTPTSEAASPTAAPTGTPSPAFTLTPDLFELPTRTPGATTTAVPGIIEVSNEDIDTLAGLCWVEGRGFLEKRQSLCASILSTVFRRIREGYLSDGTVYGTITWGCTAESEWCQFPAWVATGCDGILPSLCPTNHPADLVFFKEVVYKYLFGWRGECNDYLYYGSRDQDLKSCIITASNGQREGFFNE